MAYGIQFRDASGNITLDLSKRLGRIIGVLNTGAGTSGSVVNALFSTGVPFFFTVPNSANDMFYSPTVSIVGNTLSWQYTNTLLAQDTRIFYGIC